MSNEQRNICVTHINIRLSISILLLKLLFIEAVAGSIIIFFHTSLFLLNPGQIGVVVFNIPLFIMLVTLKTMMTIYALFQWLNEYYEITPDIVFHRRGAIFKTEERYQLSHIALIDIKQTLLGRLLNFGTISLYDQRRNKYEDMYMIHNPLRYAKIIEELLPQADERREVWREQIIEPGKINNPASWYQLSPRK